MRSRADSSISSVVPSPERLAAYLAAGVGTSLLATAGAEAAVVAIDLGPSGFNLQGVNGGVASSGLRDVWNFPVTGSSTMAVSNGGGTLRIGLAGNGPSFQLAVGGTSGYSNYASPTTFASNASISNAGNNWTHSPNFTCFSVRGYYGHTLARASFGAGNYLGFRFNTTFGSSDYYYGYIEATWDSTTQTFQLFSAAYESTANTAILAGAASVPAPSVLALMALGGGTFRRARQRAA